MPLDTRLEEALTSTVRINNGSGILLKRSRRQATVIVTAAHVIDNKDQITIQHCSADYKSTLCASDSEYDIAILAAPPEIEHLGIELGDCKLSDEIWALGYPSGWNHQAPVISRGVISGIAEHKAWIDAAAGWGHSGGPVVQLCDEGYPRLVAVISGVAGRVHQRLEESMKQIKKERNLVDEIITQRVKDKREPEPALGLASFAATRLYEVVELIHQHFRAGFTEVVLSSAIAQLRGS